MSDPDAACMRLCAYRIAGPGRWPGEAAKQMLAGEFAARLWGQCTDADRVQHIRIRPADPPAGEPPEVSRLDVGILLMADSDDKARAVGVRLCTGALAAGPHTVGWTLQPLF